MQMICKYGGKNGGRRRGKSSSAAVFFDIFGTEVTDSDEDAKELCDTVIRQTTQSTAAALLGSSCNFKFVESRKVRTVCTQCLYIIVGVYYAIRQLH